MAGWNFSSGCWNYIFYQQLEFILISIDLQGSGQRTETLLSQFVWQNTTHLRDCSLPLPHFYQKSSISQWEVSWQFKQSVLWKYGRGRLLLLVIRGRLQCELYFRGTGFSIASVFFIFKHCVTGCSASFRLLHGARLNRLSRPGHTFWWIIFVKRSHM